MRCKIDYRQQPDIGCLTAAAKLAEVSNQIYGKFFVPSHISPESPIEVYHQVWPSHRDLSSDGEHTGPYVGVAFPLTSGCVVVLDGQPAKQKVAEHFPVITENNEPGEPKLVPVSIIETATPIPDASIPENQPASELLGNPVKVESSEYWEDF